LIDLYISSVKSSALFRKKQPKKTTKNGAQTPKVLAPMPQANPGCNRFT